MRCISLWQPWATLWVSGHKIHETRHWPCPQSIIGTTIAVHAAKRWTAEERETALDFNSEFGLGITEWPLGVIVGTVEIVACIRTEGVYGGCLPNRRDFQMGNFEPGRFAWRAKRPIMFAEPIPYKGAQGLFDVPDDLLRGRS